jgi:adenylate kinase
MGEELNRRRWRDETLEQRREGDVEKIKMAQQLRRETTMTLAWIANDCGWGPSRI